MVFLLFTSFHRKAPLLAGAAGEGAGRLEVNTIWNRIPRLVRTGAGIGAFWNADQAGCGWRSCSLNTHSPSTFIASRSYLRWLCESPESSWSEQRPICSMRRTCVCTTENPHEWIKAHLKRFKCQKTTQVHGSNGKLLNLEPCISTSWQFRSKPDEAAAAHPN